LEETLRYLNIQPSYNEEEKQAIESGYVTVPDVTNMSYREAMDILGKASLLYTVSPAGDIALEDNFNVVDQYPKPGEKLQKGGTVCLYRN
jgi:stage V sporulation protein D (sporulation-specific penicillin-binding protein)